MDMPEYGTKRLVLPLLDKLDSLCSHAKEGKDFARKAGDLAHLISEELHDTDGKDLVFQINQMAMGKAGNMAGLVSAVKSAAAKVRANVSKLQESAIQEASYPANAPGWLLANRTDAVKMIKAAGGTKQAALVKAKEWAKKSEEVWQDFVSGKGNLTTDTPDGKKAENMRAIAIEAKDIIRVLNAYKGKLQEGSDLEKTGGFGQEEMIMSNPLLAGFTEGSGSRIQESVQEANSREAGAIDSAITRIGKKVDPSTYGMGKEPATKKGLSDKTFDDLIAKINGMGQLQPDEKKWRIEKVRGLHNKFGSIQESIDPLFESFTSAITESDLTEAKPNPFAKMLAAKKAKEDAADGGEDDDEEDEAGDKKNSGKKPNPFAKKGAAKESIQEATDAQISALKKEALAHGDKKQAALCDKALAGNSVARKTCEQVIADNASHMEESESLTESKAAQKKAAQDSGDTEDMLDEDVDEEEGLKEAVMRNKEAQRDPVAEEWFTLSKAVQNAKATKAGEKDLEALQAKEKVAWGKLQDFVKAKYGKTHEKLQESAPIPRPISPNSCMYIQSTETPYINPMARTLEAAQKFDHSDIENLSLGRVLGHRANS